MNIHQSPLNQHHTPPLATMAQQQMPRYTMPAINLGAFMFPPPELLLQLVPHQLQVMMPLYTVPTFGSKKYTAEQTPTSTTIMMCWSWCKQTLTQMHNIVLR